MNFLDTLDAVEATNSRTEKERLLRAVLDALIAAGINIKEL